MVAPDEDAADAESEAPDSERPSLILDAAVPVPRAESEPRIVITGWRTFLRDGARHPASWPLPAWLVFGLVQLLSSELWFEERVGDYLILFGSLSLGYWGAPFVVDYMRYTTMGMRAPSDEEVGCTVWFVRLLCLLGLYLIAGQLVWTYVL